ncbi:FMN-dependent NADH-azoreductase [Pseudomaricurvus alcaniphilus]|uniref:FMN-dependent NADH-azoreductase n=1 Tax=Pseudomaricurvus alcaniphilus TaxID=1166482 RepID=UPI00140DEDD9|nr:FMN-dependent NADH-azoreductase [Pseudomaricurvus alcaniphilus]NHN36535.1 FMN-dependent NADH-azoreductase [Pseudomaricurvus alcaniphilus]
MTTILHIASSSNLNSSVTRRIGSVAIDVLSKKHPAATIIERDLVKQPIPHVSPSFLEAMFAGEADTLALELSDLLINELLTSDIIMIEVPMYNFSIPSVLKAWIDHVARAGKTFQYGAEGPEGLVTGKRVILVMGRGGIYTSGPAKVMDYQEPYLRSILGFLGMTNIDTIYIEGVAMGPEAITQALTKAEEHSHALLS